MRLDVSVNMLTMQALTNGEITVFGGDQIRPNIHIDDITDLYVLLLERPELRGIYNAGFENISILDIARMVDAQVPTKITVTPSNDPRSYRINSDKLLATGFTPEEDGERRDPRDHRQVPARRAEERGPALQSALDAAERAGVTRPIPASSPEAKAGAAFGKVLVIGSNSFTGAEMVRDLLDHGADVVGVSRSPEPHEAFLPYRWTNTERFRLPPARPQPRPRRADGADRGRAVSLDHQFRRAKHGRRELAQSRPLVHDQCGLRPCDCTSGCGTATSCERYVHVTTPEVYGNATGTLTEDAPFDPSTPYAVSRAAGDMSLRSYFRAYQFPVLYTRAANVYGPGQRLYRIVPRTILFIRLGRKLQLARRRHLGALVHRRLGRRRCDAADRRERHARRDLSHLRPTASSPSANWSR